MGQKREPLETPDTLRELARRCRIIASGVTDPDKSRIAAYARRLEHQARSMEEAPEKK